MTDEFVRVTDLETGAHVTVPTVVYEVHQSAFRLLKTEDALDRNGLPAASSFPESHTSAAPTSGGKAADHSGAATTTEATKEAKA